MTPQKDKAFAFKALHDNEGMFVLPNPWDVGSARILAGLGFKALASTSAGFAASTGVADYQITRDLKLAHIRALAPATPLPLTADLENGFGHSPETCAETIRLGAEAGLLEGDGQFQTHIITLASEIAMLGNANLDQRITGGPAHRRWLSLGAQAQHLPVSSAGWHGDIDRAPARQRDAMLAARCCSEKVQRQGLAHIATLARLLAGLRAKIGE